MAVDCMTLNIAIADDHPVVLNGLQESLSSKDIRIIGKATLSSQIVPLVLESNPDVLVMESRLGGKDALRSLEDFEATTQRPPVVVFSGFPESSNVARASALGCHDYIPKSSPVEALTGAILRAARGEPTPQDSLLNTVRSRMRNSSHGPQSALTDREMQRQSIQDLPDRRTCAGGRRISPRNVERYERALAAGQLRDDGEVFGLRRIDAEVDADRADGRVVANAEAAP